MQQTVVAVKSEQKRTDHACASRVTESAYHAINCSNLFYLNRGGAFSRGVRSVQALSNDAVKIATRFLKPTARNAIITS